MAHHIPELQEILALEAQLRCELHDFAPSYTSKMHALQELNPKEGWIIKR